MPSWSALLCGIFMLLLVLYIRHNDRVLRAIPPLALKSSPERWSMKQLEEEVERHEKNPINVVEFLPTKTGRRYIVVGGGGFVGGWIVRQLIQRGEDPLRIRILDLRPPTAENLVSGPAAQAQFIKVDITDYKALELAFRSPWPSEPTMPLEVTVFNTAASILHYERHLGLLHRSEKVNVVGTQNILNASLSIGTSILIYTSSSSVPMSRNQLINWPWSSSPAHFVEVLSDASPMRNDDDTNSNYTTTKAVADRMIREADRRVGERGKMLRTGCIRPGNVIFGPNDGLFLEGFLRRKFNPMFCHNMVQSDIYVENCAEAHLRYEDCLIQLQSDKSAGLPDIGGDAFLVTDSGVPPVCHEIYDATAVLTDGEVSFPKMSPTTLALFIAYPLEFYHVSRVLLTQCQSGLLRWVGGLMPPLVGDLVAVQPAMLSSAIRHIILDDSRARLPPAQGGLGYRGAYTTIQGVVKTVVNNRRKSQGHTYKRPTLSDKAKSLFSAEGGDRPVYS